MDSKTCTKCWVKKPIIEFSKRARRGKKFYESRCKACSSKHASEYNRHHPEDARRRAWESELRTKFGITPEEYGRLFIEQDSRCAICRKPPHSKNDRRKIIHFHVDHDHATNALRGLLCGPCNQAIGLMGDAPELLLRMVSYLSEDNARG